MKWFFFLKFFILFYSPTLHSRIPFGVYENKMLSVLFSTVDDVASVSGHLHSQTVPLSDFFLIVIKYIQNEIDHFK